MSSRPGAPGQIFRAPLRLDRDPSPVKRVRRARDDKLAEPDPDLVARIHRTHRLRDAFDDICRRHSHRAAAATTTTRRHNRTGKTRAIPLDEDDIINLQTLEIELDRGVIANSRKGNFAFGGHDPGGPALRVVRDTGHRGKERDDERQQRAGGGGFEIVDDDDDDDQDEDEQTETGDDADDDDLAPEERSGSSSEDEFATFDDMESLPNLGWREDQKRREEAAQALREFEESERAWASAWDAPRPERVEEEAHVSSDQSTSTTYRDRRRSAANQIVDKPARPPQSKDSSVRTPLHTRRQSDLQVSDDDDLGSVLGTPSSRSQRSSPSSLFQRKLILNPVLSSGTPTPKTKTDRPIGSIVTRSPVRPETGTSTIRRRIETFEISVSPPLSSPSKPQRSRAVRNAPSIRPRAYEREQAPDPENITDEAKQNTQRVHASPIPRFDLDQVPTLSSKDKVAPARSPLVLSRYGPTAESLKAQSRPLILLPSPPNSRASNVSNPATDPGPTDDGSTRPSVKKKKVKKRRDPAPERKGQEVVQGHEPGGAARKLRGEGGKFESGEGRVRRPRKPESSDERGKKATVQRPTPEATPPCSDSAVHLIGRRGMMEDEDNNDEEKGDVLGETSVSRAEEGARRTGPRASPPSSPSDSLMTTESETPTRRPRKNPSVATAGKKSMSKTKKLSSTYEVRVPPRVASRPRASSKVHEGSSINAEGGDKQVAAYDEARDDLALGSHDAEHEKRRIANSTFLQKPDRTLDKRDYGLSTPPVSEERTSPRRHAASFDPTTPPEPLEVFKVPSLSYSSSKKRITFPSPSPRSRSTLPTTPRAHTSSTGLDRSSPLDSLSTSTTFGTPVRPPSSSSRTPASEPAALSPSPARSTSSNSRVRSRSTSLALSASASSTPESLRRVSSEHYRRHSAPRLHPLASANRGGAADTGPCGPATTAAESTTMATATTTTTTRQNRYSTRSSSVSSEAVAPARRLLVRANPGDDDDDESSDSDDDFSRAVTVSPGLCQRARQRRTSSVSSSCRGGEAGGGGGGGGERGGTGSVQGSPKRKFGGELAGDDRTTSSRRTKDVNSSVVVARPPSVTPGPLGRGRGRERGDSVGIRQVLDEVPKVMADDEDELMMR